MVGSIGFVAWPKWQSTGGLGTPLDPTQNPSLYSTPPTVTESPSNASSSPPSGITNMTAPEGTPGPDLCVIMGVTGVVLQLLDVFRLIIAVLVDVASLEATHPLQEYVSPPNSALDIDITFAQPVIPRTRPPFFEVRWLMQSMIYIPVYMFQKGVFREAGVLLEVDGVRVADGFLGEKGVGARTSNISTS